jgi:hypothetical protein
MPASVASVTNPIALCAYVVAVVFGLLARKWNSRGEKPGDRRIFYLAASVAIMALAGGLFLAWRGNVRPNPVPPAGPVVQQSSGDQSPNISTSGNGSVTLKYGDKHQPKKQEPQHSSAPSPAEKTP